MTLKGKTLMKLSGVQMENRLTIFFGP